MADSLGLKRACRPARDTGWIEGPAYCGPPVPCQTSTVVLVTLAAGARLLLAAAATGIARAGRGVVAPTAMALGSRGAGFLRCELVGVARSVRCTPPSAAISRWRSGSIEANPRPEPDCPWLLSRLPWL